MLVSKLHIYLQQRKMDKSSALILLLGAAVCMVTCDDKNSEDLYHPCAPSNDIQCVRSYFEENSYGKVVTEPNEEQVYEINLPIYTPAINVTSVATKSYVYNNNGKVETFYMDKKTGNLVMTVDFDGFSIYCPDTIFAVSLPGREPKVVRDDFKAIYNMAITAVLPALNGVTADSLKHGEYSAYVRVEDSVIEIGPKFTNSEDPDIAAAFSALIANPELVVKEIFETKASFDFLGYLQNYVSDFGIQPVLKDYDATALINIVNSDKNEDTENFEPCAQKDQECVSNFLDEQSADCKAVINPADEVFIKDKVKIFLPLVNSGAVIKNTKLSGLDGKIEEFYISQKSGNLVISVGFKNLTKSSPNSSLIINQKDQQPRYITDEISVVYSLTINAVIPMSEGLTREAIENSFITSYSTKPGSFYLGQNFLNSEDSQMAEIIKNMLTYPNTITAELLRSEAPILFRAYLQKYLCDFGIPLASSL